ncbi:MAG TPA: hypothetical protein VF487_08345 [Chitinophagaceae bacterium]
MSKKESNKQKMVETVEKELPDFVKMIKTTKDEIIVFHQDAFAADYQMDEFMLLGMAIKYAGLHDREITIINKV